MAVVEDRRDRMRSPVRSGEEAATGADLERIAGGKPGDVVATGPTAGGTSLVFIIVVP